MKKGAFKCLYLVSVFLCSVLEVNAQLDSIVDMGVYRTFIVHTPAGYTPDNQYPLVINLHGLNSNAAAQQAYSQFDPVADAENFIVVYPNALEGSWAINGESDVNFIIHLIDTLRSRYSLNDCLFVTGMSMGGFLTYKLACALPQPPTAVAVVSGNMAQPLLNTCFSANGLPVLHFHGTSDPLVDFNGTFGIPPVETTIQWWVNENNCSDVPMTTLLPNTHPEDNCTVEKYEYTNGSNGSEVIFYKIINGGHTWPGSLSLSPLGNTNQDIEASELIGSFFRRFCTAVVDNTEVTPPGQVFIYPNPANSIINIRANMRFETIDLYDLNGKVVASFQNPDSSLPLPLSLAKGMYLLRINTNNNFIIKKICIK
ncbi:MAG: T9SS type A sorting domain-containing protein [Saprospiraceae bacterium]|nr:T9SS type A sorting domain-containing protein [Saprospiraceae bacterium]